MRFRQAGARMWHQRCIQRAKDDDGQTSVCFAHRFGTYSRRPRKEAPSSPDLGRHPPVFLTSVLLGLQETQRTRIGAARKVQSPRCDGGTSAGNSGHGHQGKYRRLFRRHRHNYACLHRLDRSTGHRVVAAVHYREGQAVHKGSRPRARPQVAVSLARVALCSMN
jgi:hypothetical protein